jgi:cation:H+ antiporter
MHSVRSVPDLTEASLSVVIAVFAVAAGIIALVGTRLTRVADWIADKTGLGEAVIGAALLGASTSLAGSVTSITAAAKGMPQLAIGNAIGGIAVQTAFLAIGDMTYRRANLEHAAASVGNLIQGTVLVTSLFLLIATYAGPQITLWSIHPASLVLFALYLLGLRLTKLAKETPMWGPRATSDTRVDEPDRRKVATISGLRLGIEFALLAIAAAAAGYAVALAGGALVVRTGLSEAVVGTFFTAIVTSLPELVTTIAAVRQGALTLAVGGIIGGNSFDVLFVAGSDVAYRDGSVYAAFDPSQVFAIGLAGVMTGVLLLGLLHRERHGPANIGFESVLLVLLYVLGAAALIALG